MNKMKVISVLIISMLISVTAASITGAEELEGNIEVEITPDFLALVQPKINLTENQSVTFKVENKGNQSFVNDTLTINLSRIGNESEKETFFIQRAVFVGVVLARKFADIKIMPIAGFFQRLFPVKQVASATLIPGKLGNETVASCVNISINYEIDNTTASENLTMHIIAIGFLPGGGEYKKINLSVTYDLPE